MSKEEDEKGKDRGSVRALNAFDGVYMCSPATLPHSRRFIIGESAGELEADPQRDKIQAIHFTY